MNIKSGAALLVLILSDSSCCYVYEKDWKRPKPLNGTLDLSEGVK